MPSFVLFALNKHITNHWRVCQERLRQHLLKFREEIHPLELIFHRTFDTTYLYLPRLLDEFLEAVGEGFFFPWVFVRPVRGELLLPFLPFS